MATLELSLACQVTDRTQAVFAGDLSPEGIDLQPVPLSAEVASRRMLAHEDFDVAAVSLTGALAAADAEESPFVALPIFTERAFVHATVYVHRDASIEGPAGLAGARVGIGSYWSTPGVWVRGVLGDRHGLDPADVDWVVDGAADRGFSRPIPDAVDHAVADESLGAALRAADLDALVSARPPSGYPDGPVERLFDDSRSTERAYYEETGHFPILRVVVVRRAVYDRHPWVAQELVKTFEAAKTRCLEAIGDGLDYPSAVPWLADEVAATRALMGWDYWPYGIDANRETLRTFARYAAEQGLTEGQFALDDLFAPETFKAFTV